ncbi:unnamed protein product [Kuraishia capsulata CBS 1993]|uniref:Malate dehydrogenase n=1 Tax=Kuraishia capsulata CBS 1993 TaxID=1382522 RepID=W6MY07_9ASCO|nr:uncharacterized protein KUCA_T00005798001 [Kuraishia capsulata CBS 1993]CDK29805.1 unnamed protein product [Kuraishia capsulata CBS 1993]
MTKVTICGAAGGIGQPLSLLVKLHPLVDQLSLFDVVNVPGVGADLSHIDTDSSLESFLPADDGLAKALKDSDLVIIPAGVPRKPGMSRDDLFNINAGIVRDLAVGVATHAPKAFVLVISNPVNSTVPIFKEVLAKHGVFDPRRLLGVTTLDCVRSNTFVAGLLGAKASKLDVAVVGGHSGETIVPLFSSLPGYSKLSDAEVDALVHRVQYGGDEVVQAKNGAGSATLSMAYAGYKLADQILKGLNGEKSTSSAFVYLKDDSLSGAKETRALVGKFGGELDFFAIPVGLGPKGVESIEYGVLEKVNAKEEELLKVAVGQLGVNIAKGTAFIKG